MEQKTLTIVNKDGLHARPAAIFVQKANKFESDIEVEYKGNKVNGKSIIGIMSLGAFHGEEITIIAEGRDEKRAIEAMEDLVVNELLEV